MHRGAGPGGVEARCSSILKYGAGMIDLNELVPATTSLYLIFGLWINDSGEIVGQAVDPHTGSLRAFRVIFFTLFNAVAVCGNVI